MKKRTIWITSAAAAGVLAIGATAAAAFAIGSDESDDRADRAGVSASQVDAAVEAALAEVGAGTVTDIDVDDDASHAYEVDVRLDAGGSVEVKLDRDLNVVAVEERGDRSGDDDDDDRGDDRGDDSNVVIDPADRQRAIDAALAHAGGGTVSEVELSDDADHVWEVEVQLPNGGDLDVELDAAFAVVKAD
ncbi:PepSY domain-containing protein [Agromyces silvae]|uniref:PepSY domain-containing protein n=1 Tax=Agromyces silvae TaxID=3388266 RepID=UPI00280AE9FA|nr:PepSY domain-containing protein [Agromyces protaetiae]